MPTKITKANCLKEMKQRTFIDASYIQSQNDIIITITLGDIMPKPNPVLEELKKINSRLVTVETGIKDMNTRIGVVETGIKDMKTRIGVVETGIKDMNTRIGVVENGIKDMKTEMNVRFDKIDSRIDNLVSKNSLIE